MLLLFLFIFFAPLRKDRGAISPSGGRARYKELAKLTRPYTPYVVPEVLAVEADGIQATTTVAQVVLTAATVRSRGPPVAAASIDERASVVEPASNRRKSGYVASASNAPKFIVGW